MFVAGGSGITLKFSGGRFICRAIMRNHRFWGQKIRRANRDFKLDVEVDPSPLYRDARATEAHVIESPTTMLELKTRVENFKKLRLVHGARLQDLSLMQGEESRYNNQMSLSYRQA